MKNNKKTLISSMVLERFIDNYSETEYQTAWEKLQKFLTDNKDNPDLYRESAFDAEWLNEVFCNILGYPKKLKSREYWTVNGAGKKEERIDGVFYNQDGESVKMVIELKALDTPDLFKKDGKLSPITQGAKYLFQTPKSELAVVSNFDDVVVFDRKEEFRQSWSLFEMTFDQFKEFYLVLSFNSFYGNLTELMIDQSEESDKDVDEDFYSLVVSIHKSLHNKLKTEYASDLFNKFLAMAILEDCSKLPPMLIKTVFNRKTDFDHSLKSHWDVFTTFFQSMKKSKASREYLNINEEISALPIWDDISYLGRIKVPKSILDQVVSLSEYNLKSVPLDRLFFNIAKKIYNPYDGISFWDDGGDVKQFEFYSKLLSNEYKPVDICLGFACGLVDNVDDPLINLYNQLSPVKVVEGGDLKKFSIDPEFVDDVWYNIVEREDLTDENTVKQILGYLDFVGMMDIDGDDYALLRLCNLPKESFDIEADGVTTSIQRASVNTKIRVLNAEEKAWLDTYNKGSKPFSEFGAVVKSHDADFKFNMTSGRITERDEFGNWRVEEELYESNAIELYIKSKSADLKLIISSADFLQYIDYSDLITLDNARVSSKLLSDEFLTMAKSLKQLKEHIGLYEYKLQKLINDHADEVEIFRLERHLDELYEKERGFSGQ